MVRDLFYQVLRIIIKILLLNSWVKELRIEKQVNKICELEIRVKK